MVQPLPSRESNPALRLDRLPDLDLVSPDELPLRHARSRIASTPARRRRARVLRDDAAAGNTLVLPARRSLNARRRAPRLSLRMENVGAALAVLVLLGMIVVLGGRAVSGLGSARSATATNAAAPLLATITVRPGDTLWSLAGRYGDPHQTIVRRVDALTRANRLPAGATLVPGQTLLVPAAQSANNVK